MAEIAGYVLNVVASRRQTLLDAHQDGDVVAESVPDFHHSRSHSLVCFVSFEDGAITHLALGSRGRRGGTGLRRLNLDGLIALSAPLKHSVLLPLIPPRLVQTLNSRLESGGILPPASLVALIEAVRELSPDSRSFLNRFSAERTALIKSLGEGTTRALAYQKETIATAFALAGLDRRDLQEWEPQLQTGRPTSFLDGLPQSRLREDQMVVNDLTTFPGFALLGTTQHTSAIFSNDRVVLTVVMANRLPLEEQLGADLIYCNETYHSFVMVQYKAMEAAHGGARFHLPDEQLSKELARMDAVLSELEKCATDDATDGFRLSANPFFLKLCPRIVFDPDDASLIKGMYIPLNYWRRLEVDPRIRGSRDGRSVCFDNVGRYFDNTSFSTLVAGGWIGTTTKQTAALEAVIRQSIETGRTVTLAVKREIPKNPLPAETSAAASEDVF